MIVLPEWFVPIPDHFLPADIDPLSSTRMTTRWIRAQSAFWDRPPTKGCKSGYACVYQSVHGRSHQDGIYRVGLRSVFDMVGLRDTSRKLFIPFDIYIARLNENLGDEVVLNERKEPYIVDLKDKTCTCQDFANRKHIYCFHIMAVMYGLECGFSVTPNGIMKFHLGDRKS